MGIFKKVRAALRDDWCSKCCEPMDHEEKQLFFLPQRVGHYRKHEDVEYYLENLELVEKKADIPTGYYACGAYVYFCPRCAKRIVKLLIFLPVRDEEMIEDVHVFEDERLRELVRGK